MPEQLKPVMNHEFEHVGADVIIADSFRLGNEQAKDQFNFTIEDAVRFDHPELMNDELVSRFELIEKTAIVMATEVGLSDEFFKDASNVILLNAIADSWISNEERASNTIGYAERVGREREMLVDVLLMLAGDQSSAIKEIAKTNPEVASKFILVPESESTIEEDKLESFYDAITNSELSSKIEEILFTSGDGSFLEDQRRQLGINGTNESQFKVRVLNIGDINELRSIGAIPKIDWPVVKPDETEAEYEDRTRKYKIAMQKLQEEEDYANSLKSIQEMYDQELRPVCGDLPVAQVRHKTGETPELILQLREAHTVINRDKLAESRMSDDEAESALAFVRHEYAHTQKIFLRGHQIQLGLLLEERKAELVSGDKQGYADVKYLFIDLAKVTGVKTVSMLEDSLLKDDPLAAFLAGSANSLGLRNTLLLMAAKPLAYESQPGQEKRFADMKCLVENGDGSTLDIAVRETLKKRGDEALPENLQSWIDKMKDRGFYDPDFARSAYISNKEFNGLTRLNPYIIDAIDKDRATK